MIIERLTTEYENCGKNVFTVDPYNMGMEVCHGKGAVTGNRVMVMYRTFYDNGRPKYIKIVDECTGQELLIYFNV